MLNIFMMNSEEYELYKKAEMQVSDEHPVKCVCGRLATGLHEMNCRAFKRSVERRFNRLLKIKQKNN